MNHTGARATSRRHRQPRGEFSDHITGARLATAVDRGLRHCSLSALRVTP